MPRLRRRALQRTTTDPLDTILGDSTGAERVRLFFERVLVHSTGTWAGRPFILEDWQYRDIVAPLFDTLRDDGRRRYRHGYLSLPRKAGKTTVCAGISLYMTFADREPGAQVYLAAASRDQAGLCYGEAANMVSASPILRARSVVSRAKKQIYDRVSRSYCRVISADAPTAHGLNSHAVIIDEIAQQPNRELYDVLSTSMGARTQPLMLAVGTAGWDRHSIAYELYDFAKRIDSGAAVDGTFFSCVFEAADTDDWTSPEVWRKVNPSLGTFRSYEELADLCERAKQVPSLQNTFRNLYLNQWTSQETRWLDMSAWDACGSAA